MSISHDSPRTCSRVARVIAASAIVAASTANAAATSTLQDRHDAVWVAAWGAAPDSPGPSIAGSTVRQIVRTSVAGSRVRLRFSNLFGSGPITLGPVRVALQASAGAIHPSSDRAVTFGGARVVTVARGQDTLSDPVNLALPALAHLAVTVHVPEGAGASTIHGVGHQTAYFLRGDATTVPVFPAGDADASRHFLTGVEIETGRGAGTVVVLGDSITDGVGSTPDRDARWPDVLAARLQAHPATASIAVVNSGIAGNRLLNDGKPPFIGPSTLSRFERDAMNTPGVRWIVLLQGSNDVSAADMLTTPEDQVSAAQIIDGMKALVARARARGIRIYGGTMLPREGVRRPFVSTDAGREKRRAINAWIRTAGAFDGVIDFEHALRDPARPDRLHPAFDSGDHLHPNDAGYAAMAAAVDLRLFAAAPGSGPRQ
jgi:lysophospholipase L1-like esterase